MGGEENCGCQVPTLMMETERSAKVCAKLSCLVTAAMEVSTTVCDCFLSPSNTSIGINFVG